MASSDPEIKDGLTLPIWMKSKPVKEFEPFAISPPAPEDNFFFIRYPKTDALFGQKLGQNLNKIEKVVEEKQIPSDRFKKDRDWSKHTKPCQEVLHSVPPINTAVNPVSLKPKPAGTDDGFKGEGAACGNSIVKVAHQMMSKGSPRGFRVALPDDDPEAQHYDLMARRGSKSLPVTPAHSPPSSPNSRRKKNGNRYFTSPFEPVLDASGRSWLTMALLGFKKDLTASTSTLAEEDTIENRLHGGGSLAQSVESLGPSPAPREPRQMSTPPQSSKQAQAFRAKPSELREMNFWSPTSM